MELKLLTGEYHTDLEDAMMEFQTFAMGNEQAMKLYKESREYKRVVEDLFDLQMGLNTKRDNRPPNGKLDPLPTKVKRNVACPFEKYETLTRGHVHLAPITPRGSALRRASLPDVATLNQTTFFGTWATHPPSDAWPHASKDLPVIKEEVIRDHSKSAKQDSKSDRSKKQGSVGATVSTRGVKIQAAATGASHSEPKLRPRRHSFSSIYSSNSRRVRRHSCQMDSIAWENPSASWRTMIHKRTFDEHEREQSGDKKCEKPFMRPKKATMKLPKLARWI